jgi:hypothetical protein
MRACAGIARLPHNHCPAEKRHEKRANHTIRPSLNGFARLRLFASNF